MLRALRLIAKASAGSANTAHTITLDRQSRYRRRVLLKTDGGADLMLDLKTATYMADGDVLELAEGGLVRVVAAPEPLLEIQAADVLALARVAWHIGNRHTPAEITPHAIYIQPDHVLEEMVTGLGAHARHVMRAFEPEGGAYGGNGPLLESHHGHSHAHSSSHDHGHDARHNHDPVGQPAIGKRIPAQPKTTR
jgi:urease accessory protein